MADRESRKRTLGERHGLEAHALSAEDRALFDTPLPTPLPCGDPAITALQTTTGKLVDAVGLLVVRLADITTAVELLTARAANSTAAVDKLAGRVAVIEARAPKIPCFLFIMLAGDSSLKSAYVAVSAFTDAEQAFLREESTRGELASHTYNEPSSPLHIYGLRLGFIHPRIPQYTHVSPENATIAGVILGRYFC